MDRLRLAGWLCLVVGVLTGVAGIYLRFGLDWSLMVLGIAIVAIGLTMANTGES